MTKTKKPTALAAVAAPYEAKPHELEIVAKYCERAKTEGGGGPKSLAGWFPHAAFGFRENTRNHEFVLQW